MQVNNILYTFNIIIILDPIITLDITPIEHPILPFKLGNARITYSYHTFIHYFNYSTLTIQLDNIHSNINKINDKFNELKVDITNTTDILAKINFKDLEYTYQQAINKYNNLLPHIRVKRGLINALGTAFKWTFGTLDSEDGNRYDKAIEALLTNQHHNYDGLNEQISFSHNLINKLNIE